MIIPGDMVWIEDDDLPVDYRFLGVFLGKPAAAPNSFEDTRCKILSDGEIYFIEPELVHPIDDKKI